MSDGVTGEYFHKKVRPQLGGACQTKSGAGGGSSKCQGQRLDWTERRPGQSEGGDQRGMWQEVNQDQVIWGFVGQCQESGY